MKNGRLLLVILFFLIMRFTLLLTNVGGTSGDEELYRGTIGQEILSGLRYPIFDYQADGYSGGSLVIGALAAPYFKLFGSNLFALKLAPLTFAFAAMLLLFGFMRRYISEKAAFYAALFFIFSPPAFAKISLFAMGYHSESIFFSILILIFYQRFSDEEHKGRRKLWLFLWGIASGLSFWFTHITAITVLTSLIVYFWSSRDAFRRDWKIFSAGVFLGLTPWFYFNLTHRFEGIRFLAKTVIGNPVSSEPSSGFTQLLKPILLVLRDFPGSFAFVDIWKISGNFVNYIYFLAVAVMIGRAARGISRKVFFGPRDSNARASAFFLLFPIVFLIIYGFSGIALQGGWWPTRPEFDASRYFIPLHFFLFALLGLSAAVMPGRRILVTALIVTGFIGQAVLFFREPFGRAFQYQGTSYSFLGLIEGQVWPRKYQSYSDYLESLKKLSPQKRFYLMTGALHGIQSEKNISSEIIRDVVQKVSGENRALAMQSVGYGLGVQKGVECLAGSEFIPQFSNDFERDSFYRGMINGDMAIRESDLLARLPLYWEALRHIPAESQKWIYAAVGYAAGYAPPVADQVAPLIASGQISEKDLVWLYRGAGMRAASNWIYENLTFSDVVSEKMPLPIPETMRGEFYFGMGWGIRDMWLEDGLRARDWVRRIPQTYRKDVMDGIEAYERYFDL